MKNPSSNRHTICGLSELHAHSRAEVTHVLSILDPETADPRDFEHYPAHERLTLRFHDIIAPAAGFLAPERAHVEALLAFGRECAEEAGHLLIHCHMGVSRSTAAATALLLQARPALDNDEALAEILELRPQAWPNSRMIAFADSLLRREGRLVDALARYYRDRLRERPSIAGDLRACGRGAEVEMAQRA